MNRISSKRYCALLLLSSFFSTTISEAMTMSKVAIIGGTGQLGRLTVQKLVDQGVECKILARNLPSFSRDGTDEVVRSLQDAESREQVVSYLGSLKGVSFVKGDVSNEASLEELCQDCQAVIGVWGSTRKSKISDLWSNPEEDDPTHAKAINYQGVVNLIQACKASKECKRIVRITGKGEDPTGFFTVLINMLGSMAKAWNYEGERALRAQTAVDYTIIRPGIMSEVGQGDDDPNTSLALADDGGDLPVSKISYGDIANLCIECLDCDNAARTTLTAMTNTGTQPPVQGSWKSLLAKVKPDRRSFPDDMLQQHYDAVKSTLLKLSAVSTVVLSILIKVVFF